MKILMVSNTYLPVVGGLERSIEVFTKKFREWGHKVKIVIPELEGVSPKEDGIIKIPAIKGLKEPFFSMALPMSGILTKTMTGFDPDVIHAHHPFLLGEMALRMAARYQKPLIFTYHIMFDKYAHYLPVSSTFGRRFLVELAVGFANLATRVIAPSESVREILLREGVKTRIDVVPTGIDLDIYGRGSENNGRAWRQSCGIPGESFVLGYAGRLAPEKNLEFLGKVVSGFMKKNPQVHFMVAGKGPCETMLAKIFEQAGMRERFRFFGVLQGQALVNFYHALDGFIFTSKSETQGLVLCEAMASGAPVIALDAPGTREVIKDYVNGRLIAVESIEEFDDAFAWLMCLDLKEKEAIKRMARNTARLYSMDICANRALKVYSDAMLEHSAPRIKEQDHWRRLMRQLRTEWQLFANVGHAATSALTELAAANHDGGES